MVLFVLFIPSRILGQYPPEEDLARSFFSSTMEAYVHQCLPESPTEEEFNSLFHRLEGICEVVVKSPVCEGVRKGAVLECDKLDDNLRSGPNSIFGCLAGLFDGSMDIIKFIGQLIWWAVNPFDTASATSEYLEGAKAYVLAEWQRADAEVTGWEYRPLKVASQFTGAITKLIYDTLVNFWAKEKREFGCLNRKARWGLVCQAATNLLLPGKLMQGLLTLLSGATAQGSIAATNAIRNSGATYFAQIRNSATKINSGIQNVRAAGEDIARLGRRARESANAVRNIPQRAVVVVRESGFRLQNAGRRIREASRQTARQLGRRLQNSAANAGERIRGFVRPRSVVPDTTPLPAAPIISNATIPLQQHLPFPITSIWRQQAHRISRLEEASRSRSVRRAWRRTRGSMRDAGPGEGVSFYLRETGVRNGRILKRTDNGLVEIAYNVPAEGGKALAIKVVETRPNRLGRPVSGIQTAPVQNPFPKTIVNRPQNPESLPNQLSLPLTTVEPISAVPPVSATSASNITEGIRSAGRAIGRRYRDIHNRISDTTKKAVETPGELIRSTLATGSGVTHSSRAFINRVQSRNVPREELQRAAENTPSLVGEEEERQERAVLEARQLRSPLIHAKSAPTVQRSQLTDNLREKETGPIQTAQGKIMLPKNLLPRHRLNPLPLFANRLRSEFYEAPSRWVLSYKPFSPNTQATFYRPSQGRFVGGRSPQSVTTADKTVHSTFFAKIKHFFGLDNFPGNEPYVAKKGAYASFRNWDNSGGLSNARIVEDKGKHVEIIFKGPWRGRERQLLIEKDKLYRPLGVSSGHIQPGDRISIPAPFWRRQNGVVMGIKDGNVRVGLWQSNGNIRYTWASTNDVEGPYNKKVK